MTLRAKVTGPVHQIGRMARQVNCVLSTDATPDGATVDLRPYAFGSVLTASTIASVTLTPYGCATEDGTFLPLYDKTGVAVTITVGSSRVTELPAAVFSLPFLKMKSNADDGESVTLLLKS